VRPGGQAYRRFYDRVVCHYYDALIRWCFAPFGGERRIRQRLLDPVSFGAGELILDLCCGTGSATQAIAAATGETARVIGMDLSLGQVRRAHGKLYSADTRLLVADAAATSFHDAQFDKVLITHALHEMPRSARLAVLTEARRVLKPGGELVVLELDHPDSLLLRAFVWFWFFYWLPLNFETPTRRDMLRHGLANEVAEAGFHSVTRTRLAGGVFQTVCGRK
jgi:demethylmenaquinone methyltransferase/2-methoxy-6-polyprenyl-1,4-benzoquinol methylase